MNMFKYYFIIRNWIQFYNLVTLFFIWQPEMFSNQFLHQLELYIFFMVSRMHFPHWLNTFEILLSWHSYLSSWQEWYIIMVRVRFIFNFYLGWNEIYITKRIKIKGWSIKCIPTIKLVIYNYQNSLSLSF